ncbi:MAG: DUF4115 domain-containing protein [Ideonella sp.]|nr:DUF4115 domain-containing protein [Ideonella sp.]
MLRAARQAQGIQLVTLAAQLKIAPRKLEALENDQLDELQGSTFVRALAQAACRVLKVDPAPVLARLPQHKSSTLEQVSGGLNAPFKERGGNQLLVQWMSDNRWTVMLGAALLFGALVLTLAPPGFGLARFLEGSTEASGPGPSSRPIGVEASTAQASTTSSAPQPVEQMPAASVPVLAPYVAATAASAAAAAPVSLSGASAALLPPITEGSSVTIQIAALQASWVEIRDSRGKVMFSRQLAAGEMAGVEGVFPMRVKIGNAAHTTLSVRGQAVDLVPVTRDNVARLELN